MIVEGTGERLRGSFSAGVLTVDPDGDALRLLADRFFHDSREKGIVAMV